MSGRRGKLHLVKGDTVVLPCTAEDWPSSNLQVCCAVGLVPHVGLWTPANLGLRPGRRTPADLCCSHVHVSQQVHLHVHVHVHLVQEFLNLCRSIYLAQLCFH